MPEKNKCNRLYIAFRKIISVLKTKYKEGTRKTIMADNLIRGVALIVQNPLGKILILQEYETKPQYGKICGMFSVPMETVELNESDRCALIRLAEEELPGVELLLGDITPLIGSYKIDTQIWVNLYHAQAQQHDLPNPQSLQSKEVGNHQWLAPGEALELWLRRGAREMISDFACGKKNVLCEHCCFPN